MRGLLAAALCILLAVPAGARGYGGSRPFELLFLDAGAAQGALGGAFGAGADDPNVLAYNPAGLATLEGPRASLMHTSHFQDVSREHIAVGAPGWGATVDYLRYGQLHRRTLSNPDGTGLGTFSPYALSAALGIGLPLTDEVSVGAALRHTRESIDQTTGSAYSADVGAQAVLMDAPLVRIGVSIQNAGPATKFQSARESLPLNVRWGSAVVFDFLDRPFALLADANHDETGRLVMQAGLTSPLNDLIALRVGYNGRNDAGLGVTGGFGIEWGALNVDYALTPYGELGMSHLLSLGWRFGRDEVGRVLPAPKLRR
ncbi:MAG: PorV/PorQ family protein [Elusimicrobia bacterium]|nr:PorV/PorQ family protein [Elusimicrobiota bacterium]